MASTTNFRQRLESLVQKAEHEVTANPRRYKFKLALLAVLGYTVIFSILAVLVILLGGTLYAAFFSSAILILLIKKKIIIVLAVAIWFLFRAVFVRLTEPEGLALTRKDYPELWREIDDLRSQLKSLRIHNVVLVPQMNAAVSQTPRLGLIGPHKNTLVLGLELLMSLTPAQARAVLAHEFGHLSGAHGRFGNWIYRKRIAWARIGAAYDATGFGAGPMKNFMSWYVPRLSGYSFALARQQEYEADAVSAALSSKDDAASALVLVRIRDAIGIETFWKPLLERAITDPEPESRTFTKFYEHLKTHQPPRALVEQKLAEAMRDRTDTTDTHPSLVDRLNALSSWPQVTLTGAMAAEKWLGARMPEVLSHFDTLWLEGNGDSWRHRHEGATAALAYLAELQAKPPTDRTQIENWQIAALTEQFVPAADPLPLYRAYATAYPDDLDAPFVIGRILLFDRNDAEGIQHLQRAAEGPGLREQAASMLASHYRTTDNDAEAEIWLRRAEEAHDINYEARAERDSISSTDTFAAPTAGSELTAAIAAAIRTTSAAAKIKNIVIASKVVRHFPDNPVHVVLLEASFFTSGKDELGQTVANELSERIALPATWFFIPATSDNRAVARKIRSAGQKIA